MFDLREYATSFVWFVVGLFIIIWQFLFPDLIPNLVMASIKPSNAYGVNALLKAFLIVYTYSGLASFIISIMTAFFTYRRSH